VIPAHGFEGEVLVSTSPTVTPTKATATTRIITNFVRFCVELTALPVGRSASPTSDRGMAGGDWRSVRARRWVLLGPADLVHRPVGDREVDFVRRRARLLRSEAEAPEQGLGYSVVPLILLQGAVSLVCEPALSAESHDQAELLERSEVGEGGRRAHVESRGDVLEARTPPRGLSDRDDPQGRDLAMGELLEGLHVMGEKPAVYIWYPNY